MGRLGATYLVTKEVKELYLDSYISECETINLTICSAFQNLMTVVNKIKHIPTECGNLFVISQIYIDTEEVWNMPSWHIDYFELKELRTCQHRKSSSPPLSLLK